MFGSAIAFACMYARVRNLVNSSESAWQNQSAQSCFMHSLLCKDTKFFLFLQIFAGLLCDFALFS